MGEVTGITAAKMTEIANATVVSGTVNDSGHLILETAGGDNVDAGDVIGPTGEKGDTGSDGPDGVNATATVVMFAGSLAPTGWLLCDGSAVSRTTYSALYTAIGVTYGAGNGTTTFNLPNMQGRYPRQDSSNLAVEGGSDTHSHQIDGGTPAAAAEILITNGSVINLFSNQVATATWTVNNDGNLTDTNTSVSSVTEAHGVAVVGQTQTANNDPPYLNLNFIIKT